MEPRFNEAQLMHSFTAPSPADWRTIETDITSRTALPRKMKFLARNAAEAARSAKTIVENHENLSEERPSPPCAIRLHALLSYFHSVTESVFNAGHYPNIDDPERLVVKRFNEEYEEFKVHRRSLGAEMGLLPSTWHTEPPESRDADLYGISPTRSRSNIPTEPMPELLSQLYIWTGTHEDNRDQPTLDTLGKLSLHLLCSRIEEVLIKAPHRRRPKLLPHDDRTVQIPKEA